jgi:hypothetical protein
MVKIFDISNKNIHFIFFYLVNDTSMDYKEETLNVSNVNQSLNNSPDIEQ